MLVTAVAKESGQDMSEVPRILTKNNVIMYYFHFTGMRLGNLVNEL